MFDSFPPRPWIAADDNADASPLLALAGKNVVCRPAVLPPVSCQVIPSSSERQSALSAPPASMPKNKLPPPLMLLLPSVVVVALLVLVVAARNAFVIG